MRPVDPDPVAHLAAEQHVARHAERLGLGVEQRVLDRAETLGDDPARCRPGQRDKARRRCARDRTGWPTTRGCQPLDDRGDAGRAETLVELAPADDAVIGRELQEVVIAPAGIGAQHFKPGDFHSPLPSSADGSLASCARKRAAANCRQRYGGRRPMRGMWANRWWVVVATCAGPHRRRRRRSMSFPLACSSSRLPPSWVSAAAPFPRR